jgi:two-component system NtrC family sensor kinase
VSYSIVQKHHGNIELKSTPGQGTSFRVVLPRVRHQQPELVHG